MNDINEEFKKLMEYLRENPPDPLKPEDYPNGYYSEAGDMMVVLLEQPVDNYYGDWKCNSPYLTLYRAREDDRIIGFDIMGITSWIKRQPERDNEERLVNPFDMPSGEG